MKAILATFVLAMAILLGVVQPTAAQCPNGTTNYSTCGRWIAVPDCPSPTGQLCPNGGWPYGLQAVHAVLTKAGKLVIWRNSNAASDSHWNQRGLLNYWDPVTEAQATLFYSTDTCCQPDTCMSDRCTKNLFCSGHVVLPDGRVLIAGGQDDSLKTDPATGIRVLYRFDPDQTPITDGDGWSRVSLTRLADMAYRRWYPTLTVLPDNRVLTVAGRETVTDGLAETPEVFDGTNWTTLSSATNTDMVNYPFMFVLPGSSMHVLHAGPKFTSSNKIQKVKELETSTPTWEDWSTDVLHGGSALMYDRGKILKTGGAPPGSPLGTLAERKAEVVTIDLTTGAAVSVDSTRSMVARRSEHNLVALPDGKVLVVGGGIKYGGVNQVCGDGVFATERWDPEQGMWTSLVPMTHRTPDMPRMYHSTALLLPDGRVFSAGGECNSPCPGRPDKFCSTADFFEPPYLFKANNDTIGPADRPQVSGEPTLVATGSTFTLTVTAGTGTSLTRASFIRPAAVTHSNNMDQRYLPLSFASNGNTRTVTAPITPEEAPPGFYMLFFVNDLGYPSIGKFIQTWGILQASIAHSNFSNNPGNFEVDIGWRANIEAPGVDQVLFYRRSGPTGPFDPPIAATCVSGCTNTGLVHSGRWRISPCSTGYWYYEVKSSTTGTVTTSTSQKIFLVRILNCLDE